MNGLQLILWSVPGLRLRTVLARLDAWAQTDAFRRTSAVGVCVTVLALIWAGYLGCDCLFKQYDDSYITFRYAYNLASGHGLVFNVGDATDSASSFLYTLVLAAAYRLGHHDLPRVSTVLGVLCAGGSSAITYLACMRRCQRPVLSAFLAVALGAHGLISGWAVSGMETLFYTFLITLSAYRIFLLRAPGWRDAVLVTLIALTRFEGVFMLLAYGLLELRRWLTLDRRGKRTLVLQAACVFGCLAAFLLFKYLTYGTLLPHAFHLKQITALYAPNPSALWSVWRDHALGLLALGTAGLLTLPRRFESAVLVLYVLVSAVSLCLGPFADWARYSVHMLPLVVILACVPLSILQRELWPLAWMACAFIGWQAYESFQASLASTRVLAGHQACRLQVGTYLEQHPPDGPVISSDVGAIAYAAPSVSFIDAVALTSRDVLAARTRGENVDAILFAKRPVVIADTCSGRCIRPTQFSAHNWLSVADYWQTPLPPYEYGAHLRKGRVLDICTSPDQLQFAATRFKLVP